ncbi:hypothetical protein FGO68_gene2034 [Halteria grandinella]|uniref:Uncharacterized protein n=1 Tax=Halteria grandinella TaxID=5974 RepID=A0A8J8NVG8_HALGN|nr:hypothetical protein FGO68_gene2034 [Halteria grandinella]
MSEEKSDLKQDTEEFESDAEFDQGRTSSKSRVNFCKLNDREKHQRFKNMQRKIQRLFVRIRALQMQNDLLRGELIRERGYIAPGQNQIFKVIREEQAGKKLTPKSAISAEGVLAISQPCNGKISRAKCNARKNSDSKLARISDLVDNGGGISNHSKGIKKTPLHVYISNAISGNKFCAKGEEGRVEINMRGKSETVDKVAPEQSQKIMRDQPQFNFSPKSEKSEESIQAKNSEKIENSVGLSISTQNNSLTQVSLSRIIECQQSALAYLPQDAPHYNQSVIQLPTLKQTGKLYNPILHQTGQVSSQLIDFKSKNEAVTLRPMQINLHQNYNNTDTSNKYSLSQQLSYDLAQQQLSGQQSEIRLQSDRVMQRQPQIIGLSSNSHTLLPDGRPTFLYGGAKSQPQQEWSVREQTAAYLRNYNGNDGGYIISSGINQKPFVQHQYPVSFSHQTQAKQQGPYYVVSNFGSFSQAFDGQRITQFSADSQKHQQTAAYYN